MLSDVEKAESFMELTDDIKAFVKRQRLGYVATVCQDGTPSLSPKGTTTIWEDKLIFADIHSPGTVENLRHNPAVEINVVDPFVRKGYRFKGTGKVITQGREFEDIIVFYGQQGVKDAAKRIRSFVLVEVERVLPVLSPSYDLGTSEADLRETWTRYYNDIGLTGSRVEEV
jgi:uncharacterized protein